VLTFRRHRTDTAPAWTTSPAPVEFRACGLELRLIDLVDLRERSARAGFDDVAVLDDEIAELRDELVRLAEAPAAA
jgi:hypothetical protein